MPPTEQQILTQTLLPPSSLQTILPLKQFTLLFPSAQRNSAQIPVLYRALQLQRALDLDAIRENIAAESRRGREQVRELARIRARDARSTGQGIDAAAAMDGEGFDAEGGGGGGVGGVLVGGGNVRKGVHGGKSLCEGMEEAEGDLKAEVQALEDEARLLIEECEGIVDELGGLEMGALDSDLDPAALVRDLLAVQRKVEAKINDQRARTT